MNQYNDNEGKSGDDGANAIMEAATDLQEILEDKKAHVWWAFSLGGDVYLLNRRPFHFSVFCVFIPLSSHL